MTTTDTGQSPADLARDMHARRVPRAQFLASIDDAVEALAWSWRRQRRPMAEAYRTLRAYKHDALATFDRLQHGGRR